MKNSTQKSGFCSLEVLTLCIIAAVTLALFPPGFLQSRGTAQRLQCQSKQKELTLAMNAYHDTYKRFPPSCHTRKGPAVDGQASMNHDGYSFLVDILPYLEQEALWKRLNVTASLDEENDVLKAAADKMMNVPNEALALSMPMFRCPGTQTKLYADETAEPEKLQAITNYKAICATTRTAYEVSSREDSPAEGLDIYGLGKDLAKMSKTSDGAIYVGSRTTYASISDGSTNTFLLTETEEPIYSRWIVGQECGLYVMADDAAFQAPNPAQGRAYISPAGFTANRFGSDSTIPAEKQKTNLNRDYTASPYPWAEAGFRSERYTGDGKTEGVKLGPGSTHGDIMNHSFVGGAVYAVSKNVDMAVYFFLTTRAGGDPAVDPENY